MLVSVRMQLHSHVYTQLVKRYKGYSKYMYDIKFGMLKARENETALRKLSVGAAHLLTLKGRLVLRFATKLINDLVGLLEFG